MPSLIQRSPSGLLDMLGMKAGGANPTQFPDLLQPTLDIRDLYLSLRWEYLSATTGAMGTVGLFAVSTPIAAGELWMVDGASCFANVVIGAATTIAARLIVRDAQTQRVYRVSDLVTGTTGGAPMTGINDPFLMRPGDVFAVQVDSGTFGTSPNFTVNARFARVGL